MTGLPYAKWIGAGLVLAVLAALCLYCHHLGAASVQAKWDAAKAAQAQSDTRASEAARAAEHVQAANFAGIEATYLQATTHAYPSLADALPAAVATGALQLRDNACPEAVTARDVPEAVARSRAADAAATQALADRVAHSIAAVRAGDEADARERQLGAQITALQALLSAERRVAARP